MAKSLDFSKADRKMKWKITLHDGTNLVLKVPNTETFHLMESLKDVDESEQERELDSLCAAILSNNLNKVTYSEDDIQENFDIEDKLSLIRGYAEFVREMNNDPN